MKGAISAHSGSVRSLAYLSPTRACWRRVSSVQAIVISVQLCNRTEAQPAELTQLVSNRALRSSPKRQAGGANGAVTVQIIASLGKLKGQGLKPDASQARSSLRQSSIAAMSETCFWYADQFRQARHITSTSSKMFVFQRHRTN